MIQLKRSRKFEYLQKNSTAKHNKDIIPNVYVDVHTYDGYLVKDHNDFYFKSRSDLNLHFKDDDFIISEEDDFYIHPDLFLKIDSSHLRDKEQLNYWYDNKTKVYLTCDSWNGQIPSFLADIKETEENHFKLNILSRFKNDFRIYDGERNTIKVMLDLSDLYFTLHLTYYDGFVQYINDFWNNVGEVNESAIIKHRNSRKLESSHKTFSDEIIGKLERINDRLNDIDLEKLKSTLRRIDDLADSGNFDQATKMCRKLQSSASEAYDALNSIMYAAEDALNYFDPNVNVYWDAFGYKRR